MIDVVPDDPSAVLGIAIGRHLGANLEQLTHVPLGVGYEQGSHAGCLVESQVSCVFACDATVRVDGHDRPRQDLVHRATPGWALNGRPNGRVDRYLGRISSPGSQRRGPRNRLDYLQAIRVSGGERAHE